MSQHSDTAETAGGENTTSVNIFAKLYWINNVLVSLESRYNMIIKVKKTMLRKVVFLGQAQFEIMD